MRPVRNVHPGVKSVAQTELYWISFKISTFELFTYTVSPLNQQLFSLQILAAFKPHIFIKLN